MRFALVTDHSAAAALRQLARKRLASARRDAIEQTFRDMLAETIRANPIDTAQSRAAWVTALEQLGGRPPAGWQGDHPSGEAAGRLLGSLSRTDDPDLTNVAASNAVPYVMFLEYGTRRQPPWAMVRRALAAARQTLLTRLRLLFRP